MAFGGQKQTDGNSEKKEINWNEYQKYMIDTCELEKEEVLVGAISGIQDLGIQAAEDAKIEQKPALTEEQQQEIIDEYPETYFEEEGSKQYKRFPSRPQHCVNIVVDFPDIMVDRGQFFGESNEAPLRLSMGGKFYTKTNGNILGRKLPVKQKNDKSTNNKWSLPFNNTLYKMAKDCNIIEEGAPFTKWDIDQLVGKSFQFKARVYNNAKGFYTESVKYQGALGRKDEPIELDDNLKHEVYFSEDNDLEHVKQLRSEVINTMKMSEDFSGSKLEAQLIAVGKIPDKKEKSEEGKVDSKDPEKDSKRTSPKTDAKPKDKKDKVIQEVIEVTVDFDDSDIPF